MHAGDKELTALLARLHATDGTPVGSVLWDYFTGNFDRKWYATMADEADKILATLDATNISKGHTALKLFIDECRHTATELQKHTYGDEHDEKHKQAKTAFTHLHTEMIRFTAHYRWGGNVWDNTNGRY